MALIALLALFLLMHVVALVTAVTVGSDFLAVCAECMTGAAGEVVMCAGEREIGIGVVVKLGI